MLRPGSSPTSHCSHKDVRKRLKRAAHVQERPRSVESQRHYAGRRDDKRHDDSHPPLLVGGCRVEPIDEGEHVTRLCERRHAAHRPRLSAARVLQRHQLEGGAARVQRPARPEHAILQQRLPEAVLRVPPAASARAREVGRDVNEIRRLGRCDPPRVICQQRSVGPELHRVLAVLKPGRRLRARKVPRAPPAPAVRARVVHVDGAPMACREVGQHNAGSDLARVGSRVKHATAHAS